MSKGKQTKEVILEHALNLTTQIGLEALSFGTLAKETGMSKSGLYAHFSSKSQLQCDVLQVAADRYVDVVLVPALKAPRGIPRIRKLFELWLHWGMEEFSGGCPFAKGGFEFAEREGIVRDTLKAHLKDLVGAISRSGRIAVEEGHFKSDADVDQFAYEFWAIIVTHQHYARLLGDIEATLRATKAFERVLASFRA